MTTVQETRDDARLAVVAETNGGGAFLLDSGDRARRGQREVAFGYLYDPGRGTLSHLAPLLSHLAMLNGYVQDFTGTAEEKAAIERGASRLLDPALTARRLVELSELWGEIEQPRAGSQEGEGPGSV